MEAASQEQPVIRADLPARGTLNLQVALVAATRGAILVPVAGAHLRPEMVFPLGMRSVETLSAPRRHHNPTRIWAAVFLDSAGTKAAVVRAVAVMAAALRIPGGEAAAELGIPSAVEAVTPLLWAVMPMEAAHHSSRPDPLWLRGQAAAAVAIHSELAISAATPVAEVLLVAMLVAVLAPALTWAAPWAAEPLLSSQLGLGAARSQAVVTMVILVVEVDMDVGSETWLATPIRAKLSHTRSCVIDSFEHFPAFYDMFITHVRNS